VCWGFSSLCSLPIRWRGAVAAVEGVWEAALRTGHAAVAGGNGRVYEARAFERPRAGCRRLCVCPAEVQSCVGCATALPIGLA
jgi:hypothetical protein